jgi:hypothetical protein
MFPVILFAIAIVVLTIWLKRKVPTASGISLPAEPSPYAHLAGTFDEDEVTKKEREVEKEKAKAKHVSQVSEKEAQECCGGGTCGTKKQAQTSDSACCSSQEDSCCSKEDSVSILICIYTI